MGGADAPAGKRLAPFLPEIVARLRACGEPDLDDTTAARLCAMSAATIDRRLASAYELDSLPLPAADVVRSWEALTGDELETAVAAAYRPAIP